MMKHQHEHSVPSVEPQGRVELWVAMHNGRQLSMVSRYRLQALHVPAAFKTHERETLALLVLLALLALLAMGEDKDSLTSFRRHLYSILERFRHDSAVRLCERLSAAQDSINSRQGRQLMYARASNAFAQHNDTLPSFESHPKLASSRPAKIALMG